jgi:DNA-binding response OmpR family regulator
MAVRLAKDKTMRILIAEDDLAFRRFLEEILVKWGYEVVVAKDGNEAWQVLKSREAPRLAILDWMIQGITGVEE